MALSVALVAAVGVFGTAVREELSYSNMTTIEAPEGHAIWTLERNNDDSKWRASFKPLAELSAPACSALSLKAAAAAKLPERWRAARCEARAASTSALNALRDEMDGRLEEVWHAAESTLRSSDEASAVERLKRELAAAERNLCARRSVIEQVATEQRAGLRDELLVRRAALLTKNAEREALVLTRAQEELKQSVFFGSPLLQGVCFDGWSTGLCSNATVTICSEPACSRLFDPSFLPWRKQCFSAEKCPLSTSAMCGCTVDSCHKCGIPFCAVCSPAHMKACKRTAYTDKTGKRMNDIDFES